MVLGRRIFRGLTAKTTGTDLKGLFVQIRGFGSENGARRVRKIGVQQVPFNKGQPKPGVDLGPEAIIKTGLLGQLRELGHDVTDYGTMDFSQLPQEPSKDFVNGAVTATNTSAVGLGNKMISEGTSRILKDGRLCLTLGGDHSIGMGTIHGASEVHNDLAVLWVDAHSDMMTPLTTTSGKYHGMPVGFIVEELQACVPQLEQFSWLKPRIKASNLAFIGLRDVEPAERKMMDEFGILAFSMKEVHDLGVQNVLQMALEHICPGGKRALHVSFDIDVLDDLEAKSTGTPVPGGMTLREGISLVEKLGQLENLVSFDLVEVNPLIGTQDDVTRTVECARQIILNTFVYSRGGISGNFVLPKRA